MTSLQPSNSFPDNHGSSLSHYVRNVPVLAVLAFCAVSPRAEVPRVPFSGIYGATAGGGSLTGWGRHGGDNPGVLASQGYGISLSGYAPFGLEELRVTELEVSRDATRWGVSLGWRQLGDDSGPDASRVRAQGAWRMSPRFSIGGFAVGYPAEFSIENAGEKGRGGERENAWWGAGVGALLHPHRMFSIGFTGESVPTLLGRVARAGLGMDLGSTLPRALGRGAAWRLSAEYFRTFGLSPGLDAEEWRFAAALRLHPQLGIYAGYAPVRQTASLGIAFGIGEWHGYSALQRHNALGGTAVQGLRWVRPSRDTP